MSQPIWLPDPDQVTAANVSRFARWLTGHGRAQLTGDYLELWRWSVDRLDEFWSAAWDYFGIRSATPYEAVLSGSVLPDVEWFTGAQVSYVEHLFRGRDPERVALIDARGVGPGDRVAGYVPNTAEAVIAFLATASLGAVWSGCGQDYSPAAAAERLGQLEPSVLIAADGYRYGGRAFDRRGSVSELAALLPALRATIVFPRLGLPLDTAPGTLGWPSPAGPAELVPRGTSPAHLRGCAQAGLEPARDHDLSALRSLGSSGSALPSDAYFWVAGHVGRRVRVNSTTGGTDVVSAFAGGSPIMPVWPGELSAPCLGVALDAWDERGQPVRGDVGELVVTKPMPSMPVSFWNDPGGSRYREAYFGTYPGVWRHGDWITITDRCSVVVHGRSDATLNRHGIRMGSSDIYHAVEQVDEIAEALVVGVERPEGEYWMPLFVVLKPGHELDDALAGTIRRAIRDAASPRHVPDEIIAAPAIPHTRTGKKLEIPVKRILQGGDPGQVMDPGAVDNPDALRWFAAYQTRTPMP